MELAAEAAARIQQRHEQRVALFERVAALGSRAKEVSAPIAELAEGSSLSNEMLSSIQEVARRLDTVIEEAGQVANLAKEDDWTDIARDAEGLQQQLQAVKNRVLMSQRKLASQAPS
jgi:predicted nuclease with TOPRIM domain